MGFPICHCVCNKILSIFWDTSGIFGENWINYHAEVCWTDIANAKPSYDPLAFFRLVPYLNSVLCASGWVWSYRHGLRQVTDVHLRGGV